MKFITVYSAMNNLIPHHFLKETKSIWLIPLLSMMIFSIGHALFNNYAAYITTYIPLSPQNFLIEQCIYTILMATCSYWLSVRLINKITGFLKKKELFKKHHTLLIVLPFFSAVLKALIALILFNILTHQLDLPDGVAYTLSKLTSVLIICAISWILFKLIDVAERLLLHHYSAESGSTVVERKIYTQTLILKRVAYSIISILTAGAILVLFDNVRALGASVLTTAGVLGLVLTFTAQRSLASIFSGLEIALTQPIKIGDSVVIENEYGTIEEINFRNVVVKLWDWRRLVVPTSFFLEKSFQNWSSVQTNNLIGTVFLHVDFTLPVADIRSKLLDLLNKTPYWDENVGLIQVSELQERVMQLKILASARNPDDLSNLKAYLREEIMAYIVRKHHYALPKTRSYSSKNDNELERSVNKESKLEQVE